MIKVGEQNMKRCLIIINPSSGKHVIQNKLDKIIGQLILQNIVKNFDIYYTKKKNDAYNKAKSANEDDYDFIMSVGGDGTLNEVISGMVDSQKHIPLCILAAGTVNDFANYLNIPTSVNKIVEMIKNFKIVSSDVGKINDSYFVNVAAGGMFSDISFVVSKDDKKKYGPLAYYVKGLLDLPQQLRTNLNLSIRVDDKKFNTDAYMFAITNTNRVGGFDGIIPYADINDGKLDILIIKKCSVTDLIALFKDYRFGKHAKSPFIEYRQGQNIEVKCNNKNLIIDIDGEEGCHLPVSASIVNKAINIIIPKK